ncbi:DUF4148 domain-containing protein [Caballeronia sp. LZ065]|uniref:DUF4148 domain-containing protein n=1 Tax=Caballeronia sp. LZ065 TaxID=3038571 RepID=UPI00285EB37D|nr:DUF4148 domain-containing protein [Caballeronia sp. LZ065]MDR5784428.1 DUF4148 domain-containing protein [Caballeronia sp. LZ065]
MFFTAVLAADDGLSRAQVQRELEVYRCAGFNPVADEITYPADVDAARERLAQGDGCHKNRRPSQLPRVRDTGPSR